MIRVAKVVQAPAIADQSPYHWRTLQQASYFCDFCKDYGVPITEEILERLHALGILFPALRIIHGINVWEEEKGKPYYTPAGFFIDYRADWLTWYDERGMVFRPTEESFMPWSQGKRKVDDRYHTQSEADYAFTYFYDERQLFAVKIALARWKWQGYHPRLQDIHLDEKVRDDVRAYNAFHRFFLDVETMHREWNTGKYTVLEGFVKENDGNKQEALKDWRSNFKAEQIKKLRAEAESIAARHGMDLPTIKRWRSFLADQSVLVELWSQRKALNVYLHKATESALINAEVSNSMIYMLNQYLWIWKNEQTTVREVLLQIEGMNAVSCVICGALFTPPPNIKSPKCCTEKCRMEYAAGQKRDKRKRKKAQE